MIVLAPGDTLAGRSDGANAITATVFGMERVISSGAKSFKVLYQGQLPTTAATLYTAPGGSEAFIKAISCVNVTPNENTFQFFRGGTAAANAVTAEIAIRSHALAGYEDESWDVTGVRGGLLASSFSQLQDANYSSMHAETFDRNFITETNTATQPLVSGRLHLQAIWLTEGQVIRWIGWFSATTAAGTPTNQLFGLYDINRNRLATTVNGTTGAWTANTFKQLDLTTPYTVTATGLYYLGVMVTASTVPTLKTSILRVASDLAGTAPILQGSSTTGLTTTLPDPAGAITAGIYGAWGCVS